MVQTQSTRSLVKLLYIFDDIREQMRIEIQGVSEIMDQNVNVDSLDQFRTIGLGVSKILLANEVQDVKREKNYFLFCNNSVLLTLNPKFDDPRFQDTCKLGIQCVSAYHTAQHILLFVGREILFKCMPVSTSLSGAISTVQISYASTQK